jgi:hypothetical protein
MKVFQGSLYDDKVALAIISISLILVGFINIFTNVIMNIAKPLFARLRRENNENELINAYRFITRVTCYISVPFYIFLLTQGQNFLYIWQIVFTISNDNNFTFREGICCRYQRTERNNAFNDRKGEMGII